MILEKFQDLPVYVYVINYVFTCSTNVHNGSGQFPNCMKCNIPFILKFLPQIVTLSCDNAVKRPRQENCHLFFFFILCRFSQSCSLCTKQIVVEFPDEMRKFRPTFTSHKTKMLNTCIFRLVPYSHTFFYRDSIVIIFCVLAESSEVDVHIHSQFLSYFLLPISLNNDYTEPKN